MESETKFKKQVVREGQGIKPKEFQTIRIKFSMSYASPEELICKSQQLFQVTIGRGDVMPALEDALKTMIVGEKSRIFIGQDNVVGPNFQKGRDLIVELEILSFGDMLPPQQCLGVSYRRDRAKQLRSQGNQMMKNNKYHEALQIYQKAYQLVEMDTGEEIDECKNLIFANLSQAHLNCKDYQKSVDICSEILQDQPDSIKILYRRANGLRFLGRFQEAIKDVERALSIEKDSKQFQQLLVDIRKQQQESKKREKQMYGRMFSQ